MSARLVGPTVGFGAAVLAEHHALLALSDPPPTRLDAGRIGATLGRAFEGHLCARDPDECAELESMINAWAALGHPVGLWQEITTAVHDHVERTESQLWADTLAQEGSQTC